MTYRYLEDIATADAAFEAWGETLEQLFRAAAEATLQVMIEDPSAIRDEREITIEVENGELDMLLFNFLNELIFYKDAQRLLLRIADITITSLPPLFRLEAVVRGEEINLTRHTMSADVKAVTLHRLAVEETPDGWHGMVVLDI